MMLKSGIKKAVWSTTSTRPFTVLVFIVVVLVVVVAVVS